MSANQSRRFEGRCAVITGAASGIGAATARRLAAEGARVVLADIQDEPGEALAKELGAESALYVATDVRDQTAVDALIARALERFGRLDVLFNNAGSAVPGPAPDVDPEAWRNLFELNVHAVFYACRAAIPHMREAGGGAIVNTASISGLGGDHGLGTYNATKGAVVNYTRALAVDHGGDGIRVNAICPGPVDTPLAAALVQFPPVHDAYRQTVPLGRVAQPDEIAAAVAFLASDDASIITGVCLVADGGITAWTGQPNFPRIFSEHLGEPGEGER